MLLSEVEVEVAWTMDPWTAGTQNRLNLEPTTRPTNSIVTATRKCRSRTSLISLKAYAITPTAQ